MLEQTRSIELPNDVITLIFENLNSYELSHLPSVCKTWNTMSIRVSESRSWWPWLYNITKPNRDYVIHTINIMYGRNLEYVLDNMYIKREYHLFARLKLDCGYSCIDMC
jgi:hypothetical protein